MNERIKELVEQAGSNPRKGNNMKNYVPLVPDDRLVEIIRGYVSDHSTETTRPDLNNEHRLLELTRLITDECQVRIPLWRLEKEFAIRARGTT
jgi:hypothetical protein